MPASPSLSRPTIHSSSIAPKERFSSRTKSLSFWLQTTQWGCAYELPGRTRLGGSGPHPNVTVGSGTPQTSRSTSLRESRRGCSSHRFGRYIRRSPRAAHIEGTVVVEAVISRNGTIESLHVLSGPAMLQSAAIEAIRGARYQALPIERRNRGRSNYDHGQFSVECLRCDGSNTTQSPAYIDGTAVLEFAGRIFWTTSELGVSET